MLCQETTSELPAKKYQPCHRKFAVSGPFDSLESWEDFFIPRFRYYPSTFTPSHGHGVQVVHLDTCTTWKGLSVKQAGWLRCWQDLLIRCLEEYMRPELNNLLDRICVTQSDHNLLQQIRSSEYAPANSNVHNVDGLPSHSAIIDTTILATRMAHMYNAQCPGPAEYMATTETCSMLAFIRTHDFLVETNAPGVATLQVVVHCDQPTMTDPICEITWRPGYVNVEGVDGNVTAGQVLTLTPRYYSAAGALHHHVHFSTNVDWLSYDAACASLIGTVPCVDNRSEFTINLVVRAMCASRFGNASLERTVRARLTLRVTSGCRTVGGANLQRNTELDIASHGHPMRSVMESDGRVLASALRATPPATSAKALTPGWRRETEPSEHVNNQPDDKAARDSFAVSETWQDEHSEDNFGACTPAHEVNYADGRYAAGYESVWHVDWET